MKKNFLLFYFMSILIFALMYFLDIESSIIILIALPFFCAYFFYRSSNSFLDFRFIYSISLGIWGGAKCIPVISDPNFREYLKIEIYPFSLILASFIPFFFRFYQIRKLNKVDATISKNLVIMWFILAAIKFFSYFKFDGVIYIKFIYDSLFNGLFLVVTGLLLISLRKNIIYVVIISIIIIFSFNIENFNRTTLLLPIAFLSLLYMNYEGISKKFLYSLVFMPIVLIIADLQKQLNVNIFSIDPSDYSNYLFKNTYLPSFQVASDYFNTFNNLHQSNYYFEFTLLKQITSIFTPRILFDDKVVTNISSILWFEGLTPGPLYYEIFLEYFYDSWFFGILLYNFLIIITAFILNKYINIIPSGFSRDFLICTYLLNLIAIFYVTRGPFIFYIWTCLIPNLICFFIFFKKNFKKYLI